MLRPSPSAQLTCFRLQVRRFALYWRNSATIKPWWLDVAAEFGFGLFCYEVLTRITLSRLTFTHAHTSSCSVCECLSRWGHRDVRTFRPHHLSVGGAKELREVASPKAQQANLSVLFHTICVELIAKQGICEYRCLGNVVEWVRAPPNGENDRGF